ATSDEHADGGEGDGDRGGESFGILHGFVSFKLSQAEELSSSSKMVTGVEQLIDGGGGKALHGVGAAVVALHATVFFGDGAGGEDDARRLSGEFVVLLRLQDRFATARNDA